MSIKRFTISGMTCSSCAAFIEKSIRKNAGIEHAEVNFLTSSLIVTFDEKTLTAAAIIESVERAGYKASLRIDSHSFSDGLHIHMKRKLAVSFGFSFVLVYLATGYSFGWPLLSAFHKHENALLFAFTQILLVLPVIVVNRIFFLHGFKTLFRRKPDMEALLTIGSTVSLAYGVYATCAIGYGLATSMNAQRVEHYSLDLYFESAAILLSLIALGKALEPAEKSKIIDVITKLRRLGSGFAIVRRGENKTEIPVESIRPGDIVVIRPGQHIPVDGIITDGYSAVDVSAITGESIPVLKRPGDHIWSASINLTGFFEFRAERVGEDTILAHIVHLIDEASSSKATTPRLADRISKIFVPAAIIAALGTAIAWISMGATPEFAISCAVAVIVISSPCALALAAPAATMAGTRKSFRHGILVKKFDAFEKAQKIDTLIIDKTGTITAGKPAVTDIKSVSELDDNELLSLAASIENRSEHPLGFAVTAEAVNSGLRIHPVENFRAQLGKGISGSIKGKQYFAGSPELLRENGIDTSDLEPLIAGYAMAGKTPICFGGDGKQLGIIAVADKIKIGTCEAVCTLRKMGIEVIMFTSDNDRTAEGLRRATGIDRVFTQLMPEGKRDVIRNLKSKNKTVAMIGDGISDAPAIIEAHIGIAIGNGTEIAVDSADVVLERSDLRDAVTVFRLGKSVTRNIRENIFFALIYNTLAIPVAAGVFYSVSGLKLSPMLAVLAMGLSSISVLLNALRLNFFRKEN